MENPNETAQGGRKVRIAVWTGALTCLVFLAAILIIRASTPTPFDVLYSGNIQDVMSSSQSGWVVASQKAYPELIENEKAPIHFPENPVEGSCAWWVSNVLMKKENLDAKSAFRIEFTEDSGKKYGIAKAFFGGDERGQIAAEGRFLHTNYLPFYDSRMDGVFKYWDPAGNLISEETWTEGKKKQ